MRSVVLRFQTVAAVLALIVASPTLAADLVAESRIDAVTVFPSEAEVVRLGGASLTPGEHVLRVLGLPAQVDPASVRVEAEAGYDLDIGAVDLRQVAGTPVPVADRGAIERRIADLEAERAVAEDARGVGESRLRMVERLTTAGGQGVADGLRDGRFNPILMRDVVTAAAAEQDAAYAAIRGAKTRVRDLDIEIKRLRAQLEPSAGDTPPTVTASIAVASKGAGPVKLRLQYRVPGAGWTPVYEARLSSAVPGKPALAFALRAEVEQETGEDWRDVALTLSTTQPSRGTEAGTLPVMVGRFMPPPPPRPMPMAAAPAPSMAKRNALVMEMDAAAPAMKPAIERGADLVQTGSIVTYRVPGRVGVTSGGEVKTLKIADERIEPSVQLRVVPKLAPIAYATAQFTRQGDDALLPGRVQLYRDGVYVGAGQIDATPAGEPVKLGFGEDSRLKVDYAPLKTEEGETGTFTTQRMEKRDTRITLKNVSRDTLAVQVEDQLPVSEMTDLKIEPLASNTPSQLAGMDGRRGALGWTLELKPSESKEIRFGWQARWPTDKPLQWQTMPR